jgi:parallel beta-helix repeat protein
VRWNAARPAARLIPAALLASRGPACYCGWRHQSVCHQDARTGRAVRPFSSRRWLLIGTQLCNGASGTPLPIIAQGNGMWVTVLRAIGNGCRLLGVWLLCLPASAATIYYVSAAGSDASTGTAPSIPWQTVNKVNSHRILPGDSVLFRRGDTWRQVLLPSFSGNSSAPIIFGAYGSGDRPVFNAAALATGWTPDATKQRWTARAAGAPNQVFFDEKLGARRMSLSELKIPDDWYYASGLLSVFSLTDPASTYTSPGVEVSMAPSAIDTNHQSYLIFDSLAGEHANSDAGGGMVVGAGSAHITITECEFSWDYANGIWIYQSAGGDLRIIGNDIHDNASGIYDWRYTGGTALSPVQIAWNRVHDNRGGDGILIYGNYFTVDHNLVYNNGREAQVDSIGIHIFTGDSRAGARFGQHNVISWNTVSHQRSNGEDGSGIEVDHYTRENILHDNVVYANDGPGIDLYDCTHIGVYENTAYGNSNHSTGVKAEISLSTLGANLLAYARLTKNIGYATCGGCAGIHVSSGVTKNREIMLTDNQWGSASGNPYSGAYTGTDPAGWNRMRFVHDDRPADPALLRRTAATFR